MKILGKKEFSFDEFCMFFQTWQVAENLKENNGKKSPGVRPPQQTPTVADTD